MADGSLTFDTKMDSSGFTGGLSKIGAAAQSALGVFTGNLMTKAFDSLTEIGKSALDSVSSLEQNVGGVQTLFGNAGQSLEEFAASNGKSVDEVRDQWTQLDQAQNLVLDNADKAYQTCGMSANDYMQTVTSFAAALKQSTSDSTEAAKVADTAMQDMSDNANKMGTDMGSIQTAYQGFAKQNYTMLDNLKLGYGGTKSEMERLLSDAQKITGVKYDINNLSDVYSAIHVIQGELGITGTTAKEASTTIEGSMNSAKAAWDNLMAGTGDADQFADAFSTAATNIVNAATEIIPRLATALPKVISAIGKQIPKLIQSLLPAVVNGITALMQSIVSAIPELISVIGDAIPIIGQAIIAMMSSIAAVVMSFDFAGIADQITTGITGFIDSGGFEKFVQSAMTIITGLATGIAQALPKLVPAIVQLILYIGQTLIENLPQLITAALALVQGLAQGIINSLPVLIAAIPQIITTIVQVLTECLPQIIECAAQIIIALVQGITENLPAIVAGLQQILQCFADLGAQLLQWIAENCPQWIQNIGQWISQLPGIIWQWLSDALQNFAEWGGQVLQSVGQSMSSMLQTAIQWMSELPGNIWNWLVQAWNRFVQWGVQVVTSAATAMSNMLSTVVTWVSQLPGQIWNWLIQAATRVVTWGVNMVTNASTAMSNMLANIVSWMMQLPGKIWEFLSQAAAKVVSWGGDLATKGAAAAKQLFNAVVDGVKSLPDKMKEIGSNIVSGIWNGISSGWDWLKDKVSHLATSLLDTAKNALGIGSPSRKFRDEVGRWIMPGVGQGIVKSMPNIMKTVRDSSAALVDEMQTAVNASLGDVNMHASAALAGTGGGTTVYNDNRMEQNNTYNVPTATPSEVARTQRDAMRRIVGGVK